jgi:hypothetical protein
VCARWRRDSSCLGGGRRLEGEVGVWNFVVVEVGLGRRLRGGDAGILLVPTGKKVSIGCGVEGRGRSLTESSSPPASFEKSTRSFRFMIS